MARAIRGLGVWVVLAALAACGGTASRSGSAGPSSVRIAWNVHIKAKLGNVAAGQGAVWLALDHVVLRVDPASGKVISGSPVAGIAGVITVGDGAVWAAYLTPDRQNSFLVRIDPATNQVAAISGRFSIGEPTGIAVGPGAVWVDTDVNGGEVYVLDPNTLRAEGAPIAVDQAGALALEGTTLWVAQGQSGLLTRIDTSAHRIEGSPIKAGSENLGPVVAFGRGVWAGSDASNIVSGKAQVVRVEPGGVTQRVDTPGEMTVQGLASAFGRIWVLAIDGSGQVQGLDPAQGALIGSPLKLPSGQAVTLASGDGALWVTTADNHLIKLVPA